MSVRASMSDLIARVHLMVADTPVSNGQGPLFSDQNVQDKLDECRTDVYQALLTPRITFTSSGFQYNDYYYIIGNNPRALPTGFWEASETVLNGSFATITPTASDELVGHWQFNNQLPPVLIRGSHYDIYRAAADLLDYKIANLAATQVDFTADGRTFRLSQQLATLSAMRDDYRRKQKARTHATPRLDAADAEAGAPGIQPRQGYLVGSVSAQVPFLTGE